MPPVPSLMDTRKLSESSPSASSLAPYTDLVSDRHPALLELLKSERSYASDLALIRDVYIPLALGAPAAFHGTLPASNSSFRTLSSSSISSPSSHPDPPMAREDADIIFGNISELASFADMFAERLEDALGVVLEGGVGEDRVGRLILDIASSLEPPYTTYITRYPSALARLQGLPQTSALSTYFAHTSTLTSSLTDAWDLPSLLIKPVQRLSEYPLLLVAVIDETPDIHPDKENLKKAHESMVVFAGTFDEENRRWKAEVVTEVSEETKKFGQVSPGFQKLHINHHPFLDPKGNQLFAGAGSMPPFRVKARKPPLQDPNPRSSVPVEKCTTRAARDGEAYGALNRTEVDVTIVTVDDEQAGCRCVVQ